MRFPYLPDFLAGPYVLKKTQTTAKDIIMKNYCQGK